MTERIWTAPSSQRNDIENATLSRLAMWRPRSLSHVVKKKTNAIDDAHASCNPRIWRSVRERKSWMKSLTLLDAHDGEADVPRRGAAGW